MSTSLPIPDNHEGEPVSPELAPLLRRVNAEVERPGLQVAPLIEALRDLLNFLSSPTGRTSANCWTTDLFFMNDEHWSERQWEHLPEPLQDILADMAGALHDTVDYPDVALNFDSTPEQLLARLEVFAELNQP